VVRPDVPTVQGAQIGDAVDEAGVTLLADDQDGHDRGDASGRRRQYIARYISLLKGYSQASPFAPDDAAALPGAAEHQFKSTGQLGLCPYLEACAARGIIYNSAINNGSFRANDQFGRVGSSAGWPNACKPSRMHDSSPYGKIQQSGSQTNLKIPFNSSFPK
jgi:hypothetical protein